MAQTLPRNFDARSLALQDMLKDVEQEVLRTLPLPFGSLEKAKYCLKPFSTDRKKDYSFVTTSHNTEDAVEIMRQKFQEKFGYKKLGDKRTKVKYFCVLKIVGGTETKVFQTERFRP